MWLPTKIEYHTNRVQLRLGGGWRIKLHELVLELVALCLDEFLSNEPFHLSVLKSGRSEQEKAARSAWLVSSLVDKKEKK